MRRRDGARVDLDMCRPDARCGRRYRLHGRRHRQYVRRDNSKHCRRAYENLGRHLPRIGFEAGRKLPKAYPYHPLRCAGDNDKACRPPPQYAYSRLYAATETTENNGRNDIYLRATRRTSRFFQDKNRTREPLPQISAAEAIPRTRRENHQDYAQTRREDR